MLTASALTVFWACTARLFCLSALYLCANSGVAHCCHDVRLPNVPIAPFGLADVSGTTELMSVYASRSQNWTLGVSTSLAWPRCVRRTSGGSNAVLQSVNGTANAIGYVLLSCSYAELLLELFLQHMMHWVLEAVGTELKGHRSCKMSPENRPFIYVI